MPTSEQPTILSALYDWSRRTPAAIALTEGDREIGFAELAALVDAAAARLVQLGVQRGDRVIVVGDNTAAWVVTFLATMRIGAISVPMNNRLAASQVRELVDLLECRIALADERHLEMFVYCPDLQVLAITGTQGQPFDGIPAAAGPLPALPEPGEDALISFTSGTTGVPKGAVITHDAYRKACQVYYKMINVSGPPSTLIVAPLFHNTGFVDQLATMILAGGRSDLLLRYRTQEAIAACRRRPISFVTAVPSVLRMMMTAEGADAVYGAGTDVLFGGSPMPAPWSLEMHRRWPNLRLWHGYGLTEFTSCCTVLPAELILTHGNSIGGPVSGAELRIVSDDGTDTPEGEVGEIWMAGATRMREYWRRPDVTAEKLSGKWLRTGDLAWRDAAGLIYHVGRKDDVINRGGEKVLPSFVETALAEAPAIAQAVVFAVPHPILQNSILAAAEPRPGAEVDVPALLAFLRERLPGYAVPENILISTDLPRTASGKLDRRAVRAAYLATNPQKTS